MKRRATLVAAALGTVAAAAGLGLAIGGGEDDEDVDRVWSMVFERPEGGTLALGPYRGRPLLLNFWAPWCAPCVTEMPLLDRFHAEHQGQGWSVIGLAIDRLAAVQDFLRRQPVAFPIALAGADGFDLGRMLGNAAGGLPFSVAFGRAGRVVERKLGELDAPVLRRWAAAVP